MGTISDILEMAGELPAEKRKILIQQLQALNDNKQKLTKQLY